MDLISLHSFTVFPDLYLCVIISFTLLLEMAFKKWNKTLKCMLNISMLRNYKCGTIVMKLAAQLAVQVFHFFTFHVVEGLCRLQFPHQNLLPQQRRLLRNSTVACVYRKLVLETLCSNCRNCTESAKAQNWCFVAITAKTGSCNCNGILIVTIFKKVCPLSVNDSVYYWMFSEMLLRDFTTRGLSSRLQENSRQVLTLLFIFQEQMCPGQCDPVHV